MHEKTFMACSYLNFSIHQSSKNGGFCEELLSENDFEAVLVNFCCYKYIIVPMLLSIGEAMLQKQRLAHKGTAGVIPTH